MHYKNWTKETVFVYILCFIFIAFLTQSLIYTINIWLNFMFDSFSEQDHLLNLIILGAYAQRWPRVHVFQNKEWCSLKYDRLLFSNFDCLDLSIVNVKKYWSTGLISQKKTKPCKQNLRRSHQWFFCSRWFFTMYLFCACG